YPFAEASRLVDLELRRVLELVQVGLVGTPLDESKLEHALKSAAMTERRKYLCLQALVRENPASLYPTDFGTFRLFHGFGGHENRHQLDGMLSPRCIDVDIEDSIVEQLVISVLQEQERFRPRVRRVWMDQELVGIYTEDVAAEDKYWYERSSPFAP